MEEEKTTKPSTSTTEATATTSQPLGARRGRMYSTRIVGLRMATTYSFEVRPVHRDGRDLADPESISSKIIIVPTKGCKKAFFFFVKQA